ncbi:O-antigen ligase family protein [Arenimonas sp. MALMAid1274]|uniref:O-antigen ligase family protein n=1 Tax=Arenimonas sp. MALMAid1274 TaxID=3411630 RepID=UPI003B9EC2D9
MNLARTQWLLAAATLVLAVLLGGGQGTLGDTLCQLLAVTLLVTVVVRQATDTDAALPRVAWLALVPVALPLLQLLPVPEALWTMPAARADIAAQLASVGVEPPHRLGLVPLATERALFWLLPAVSLFLATLQMTPRARLRLVLVFLALAAVSMVLGIAQLSAGKDSGLRFYDITNPSSAVGFFANRNHFAMLLVAAIPFVMIGTAAQVFRRLESGQSLALWIWAGAGAIVLLFLSIATAGSRAGLLLGVMALVLSVPAVMGFHRSRRTKLLIGSLMGAGAAIGLAFVVFGATRSFSKDPLEESRVQFANITLEAARAHAPLGTGLGGFRRAFEGFDTQSPLNVYVNHAHSDPVELWLEGGWLFPPLALVLGAAFLVAGWRAWRHGDGRGGSDGIWVSRAAWIALLLISAHSFVDYPLRTTTHLALAGLLAACLVRAARPSTHLRIE